MMNLVDVENKIELTNVLKALVKRFHKDLNKIQDTQLTF